MARPRAGDWLDDEVAYWKHSGVDIVVSLLEPDEIRDLGLEREVALCEENGIRYLSFPIPDRGIPETAETAMLFAADIASQGAAIAIHCRAGIGRSSIMAAAVLVSIGVAPDAALMTIQAARRLPIPDTDSQRDWVLKLERL